MPHLTSYPPGGDMGRSGLSLNGNRMWLRIVVILAAIVGGYVLAMAWPEALTSLRSAGLATEVPSGATGADGAPKGNATAVTEESTLVKLTDEQIKKAGIENTVAVGGLLARHLTVPGTIVPDANNVARIAVKTTGTVAELRKGLGDLVAKDEVVALLDSREIADAKSEYLVARVSADLQKTLFDRERVLWDKRISSEQNFLRAQASYEDLKVKTDAARRKLTFLGLGPGEIEALPSLPAAQFERQAIRSPIAGRIVDRRVELGTAVGRDNLETELYSVVNLAQVWVELAVTPDDLPLIREGQKVRVATLTTSDKTEGKIIFIGPVLDKDTRSARVVAQIENPHETWRPGSFIAAEIVIADDAVRVMVPSHAIQKIGLRPEVFVKVPDGYEARKVSLGRADDEMVEITAGLSAGETIAAVNSFILKAELLKVQAED